MQRRGAYLRRMVNTPTTIILIIAIIVTNRCLFNQPNIGEEYLNTNVTVRKFRHGGIRNLVAPFGVQNRDKDQFHLNASDNITRQLTAFAFLPWQRLKVIHEALKNIKTYPS